MLYSVFECFSLSLSLSLPPSLRVSLFWFSLSLVIECRSLVTTAVFPPSVLATPQEPSVQYSWPPTSSLSPKRWPLSSLLVTWQRSSGSLVASSTIHSRCWPTPLLLPSTATTTSRRLCCACYWVVLRRYWRMELD